MAALLPHLPAETRWAPAPGGVTRVGVFLEFDRNPSPSTLLAMQSEVGAVLAQTGARFSWLMLNAGSAEETFDALAVLRFKGSCNAGEWRAPAGVSRPDRNRTSLGYTDVSSAGVTGYTHVECGEIRSCVEELLGTYGPREREEVFGRAMGRVVAHELYHILGSTTGHAHSGIAKALQTPFDLVRRDFQLDRSALLLIRQRLSAKKEWGGPALTPDRPELSPLASDFSSR